jgi:hypothetical protein
MAQYRNYDWYIGRFKGEFLKFKGKQRPGKSIEEARDLVERNLKRPGGGSEKFCATKAFKDVYGVDYMSASDHKIFTIEQEKEALRLELEAMKAAKAAEPQPATVAEVAPDAPVTTDTVTAPMTDAEFEARWRTEHGYGPDIALSNIQKANLARAWKKYCASFKG